MNYLRLVLLSMITLSACNNDEQKGEQKPIDADGGVVVADKATLETFGVGRLLDATWGVLDLADQAGPVALVRRDDGLFAKSEHREVQLTTGDVQEASLSARDDDTVCAVWLSDEILSYGCAPSFSVIATYGSDGDGYHLSVSENSTTVWYQSGASADAIVLQGSTFTSQELFESSISYFEDSTVFGGRGYGCLHTSSGRAEITGYTGATGRVDSCVLSQNGPRLGLLAASTSEAWYGVGTEDSFGGILSTLSFPAFGALGLVDLDDKAVVLRSQGGEIYAVVLNNLQNERNQNTGRQELTADITEGAIAEWAGVGDIGNLVAFGDGQNVRALASSVVDGESVIHDLYLPASAFPSGALGEDNLFEPVEVAGSVYDVETAQDGTTFYVAGDAVYRLGESEALGNLDWSGSLTMIAIDATHALFTNGQENMLQALNGTLGASELRRQTLAGTVAGIGYITIQDQDTTQYCVVPYQNITEPIGCFNTRIRFLFAGPGDMLDGAFVFDEDGQLRQLDGTPVGDRQFSAFHFSNRKQARDGSLWSGPSAVWNGSSWDSTGYNFGSSSAFYPVSSTEAWAAASGIIYHYTDGNWTSVESGFPITRIHDMSVSDTGRLLLAADGKLFRQRL